GQRLLTLAAFVTVALCWSGSWTAGKLGVAAIPPFELSTIRFAIAGVLVLAIARATGAPLGLARLPLLILAGAFGIFAYNALVFFALTFTPASDGALIVPTINPVLTVLFASFIGERLTANKLVGLAVATVGAAIVIAAATGLTFTGERLAGDLLMLGGAACWSAYAILGAINTRHGSPPPRSASSAYVSRRFASDRRLRSKRPLRRKRGVSRTRTAAPIPAGVRGRRACRRTRRRPGLSRSGRPSQLR